HRLSELVRGAGVDVLDFAAHHQTHNVAEVRQTHFASADSLAVAQHGVPLANALALLEKVTDVDHAHAACAQVLNHVKQVFNVRLRQAAGWLVHDQHFRPANQRAGDLDDLLFRHGPGMD